MRDRDHGFARSMLIGTASWSAFALVAVALQGGVVLDEATVPGQIIAGVVQYPGGHPHDIFYKAAYSFPNVAAAWFLSLWNSVTAFAAVRNWMFLSLSLVAPFAATLAVTRRPSWAHAAAALMLFEAHSLYDGVYPVFVFPHFYSHGHMGLQLAILAGALIVGRQFATGGVLAGMMPAMHAAMTLAVWPWLAVYLFWLRRVGDVQAFRRVLVGSGVGVLFSIAVAMLIPAVSDPQPVVAPYDTLAGAAAARAGFEAFSDTHRMMPTFLSSGYVLGPIAFVALGYVLVWATFSVERRWTGSAFDAAAIVGLGVFSLLIVYGVWVLQLLLGVLPDAIAIPMPYRFSNVMVTLLIPVTLAAASAILRRMGERDEWLGRTVVALVVAAIGVAMSGLVPIALRDAVVRQMMFVLWAVPFGLALWALGSRRESRWHVLLPAGATLLAAAALWSSSKGALYLAVATGGCAIATAVFGRLVQRSDFRTLQRVSAPAMSFAVIVCVLGALTVRRVDAARGDQLPWMISDDDRVVREWLHRNAGADELVLTPIFPRVEVQAKAGRPALFEAETLWLMTYMPHLAPQIGTMARELYGIDYENPDGFVNACPDRRVTYWCSVWSDAWKTRTRLEWSILARKYRFRLVIASSDVPLDLPAVLHTKQMTIYEVPRPVDPQDD